jgi:hypothetical protein
MWFGKKYTIELRTKSEELRIKSEKNATRCHPERSEGPINYELLITNYELFDGT